MRSPLLARRYARALYEVNPKLDADTLSKTMLGHEAELARPNISIDEVWTKIGGKPAGELANLVVILQRRKRLRILREIIDSYRLMAEESRGEKRAEVTVARELDPATKQKIESMIAANYGAKSVALTVKVDPAIIGGITIRVGDTLVDGSVSSILDDFRSRF